MKKLAYLLLAVALLAALVAYPGCGKEASNVQTKVETPTEFSLPDVPTLPQSAAATTQPQTEPPPLDQDTYEEPEPTPLPDSEPCTTPT